MRKKSVCISLLFAISLALPAQYLFALSGSGMVHCAFSEAFEPDGSDGFFDETIVLSEEDTLALLASVSDTPLMYGRYLVTNDDGLVLNILIREGYRESAYLAAIEHFLDTFRFTSGDSQSNETANGTDVSWPGIWRARQQGGESCLYIFPYEMGNGTYDVILSAEKNGSAFAAAGMIYRVDEITEEFYADGFLYAGLVQAQGTGLITLTPYSALNDALLPWMEIIEADYQYIGPLDDPDSQIPAYVWELTLTRP